LKRLIVQDIISGGNEIPVITLAPDLEQMLHQSLQAGGEDGAGIEPGLAEKIQQSLTEASQQQELAGEPSVLLTSGMLRPVLSRFLKHAVSGLHVLSYQEIPDDKQIKIVSSVGQ
ncbi:MAG: flagellar biosynthesis protein FlhA, partial [Glaciecola sp.]